MSFCSATPYGDGQEPTLFASQTFADPCNEFFDQYLTFDDHAVEESWAVTGITNSPQLYNAEPSPTHSSFGLDAVSYSFSVADSESVGYHSNYSRQPSPAIVVRGRAKTFSEQLLRGGVTAHKRRPESEILDLEAINLQSPPPYITQGPLSLPPTPSPRKSNTLAPSHAVGSLRRKNKFNRSLSNFRANREQSSDRDISHPRARSQSRSAVRKTSPRKMAATSANAYPGTLQEWEQKLAQQAAQFDFGFPSSAPPISPPPSARVSDASSSESGRNMIRTRALAQQKNALHHAENREIPSYYEQPNQYAVQRHQNAMHTPLTTPKYNELAISQHHSGTFQQQQWTTTELSQEFVDMNFVPENDRWWDDQIHQHETHQLASSQSDTSPISQNFPHHTTSPTSGQGRNVKALQLTLQPPESNGWVPVNELNTSLNTANLSAENIELTISPGTRPTPINPTSNATFRHVHAHSHSLPNTGSPMHHSHPSSPTGVNRHGVTIPGAEPSPMRHQKTGHYISHAAPPPLPDYIRSQRPSPMQPRSGSPMYYQGSPTRHYESRRNFNSDDHSSPPSRSQSPGGNIYSQSFDSRLNSDMGLGISYGDHPQPQYTLQVRKRLTNKSSEPSLGPSPERAHHGHHQRGRSSQLSAVGYQSLTPSQPSGSFPNGSPSRGASRSRSGVHGHQRSKSSGNLKSKKKKGEAGSVQIEFHNFTPQDGSRILSGVAPSGSSKTKARREKEARERQRRLSEAALRAVREAGGDVNALGGLVGVGSGTDDGLLGGNESEGFMV